MLLGSHISLNRPNKYLLGVVLESIKNGATSFMIFTGPPHNKARVPVSEFFLHEAVELGKNNGIYFSNAVVHAPYIINLANPLPENEDFNIDQLVLEIQRTHDMGIKYLVLHPGYHVNQTLEEGLLRLIRNLKKVLEKVEHLNVYICLETMAGKKNQIGKTLEELSIIISGCENHEKLAVCLDTVHLHDAGYDVSDRQAFFKEFDQKIGLERVKVLHLGDSMNERGSKKDRHANFEYGHIGFDVLLGWAYDPLFKDKPIIVETPYWIYKNDKGKKVLISPYKHEISLIRNKQWLPIPNIKYSPIYFKNK